MGNMGCKSSGSQPGAHVPPPLEGALGSTFRGTKKKINNGGKGKSLAEFTELITNLLLICGVHFMEMGCQVKTKLLGTAVLKNESPQVSKGDNFTL